uniref:G_PROTEIN_RECEP_F1_2 domain-containing protein n=1 Tax=Rhabditophanes sp. KR3021 TaxID=114890 RepID=A0AC35UFU4_9BILA
MSQPENIILSIISIIMACGYFPMVSTLLIMMVEKKSFHLHFRFNLFFCGLLTVIWTTLNVIRALVTLFIQNNYVYIGTIEITSIIDELRSIFANTQKFSFMVIIIERFVAIKFKANYESQRKVGYFLVASIVSVSLGLALRRVKYIENMSVLNYNFKKEFLKEDLIVRTLSLKFTIHSNLRLLNRASYLMFSIFTMQILLDISIQIPIIFFDYNNTVATNFAWYSLLNIVCFFGIYSFISNRNVFKQVFKKKRIIPLKTCHNKQQEIPQNKSRKQAEGDMYFKMVRENW